MSFSEIIQFLLDIGYPGVFVLGFLNSAVPGGSYFVNPVLFLMGGEGMTFLAGFFSALGATLGEVIGYGIGRGSREIIERKFKPRGKVQKFLTSLSQTLNKRNRRFVTFLIIFLFAATPLPDDLWNIPVGASKYKIQYFFPAVFFGKVLFFMVLLLSGSFWGAY